ncbi:helix-turn-helix transcriptional regulator [bacterium]|nr:helix-turn-helix transcriptional regulator [bacterium]
MNLLKLVRTVLHLSQRQAAAQFKVSRQLWARTESGACLPSAELARCLEEASQVGPLPSLDDVLSARERRQWVASARPYQLELAHPEPWRRAAKNWPYPISRLALEARTRQWMETLMVCDSAIEAYGWLQLASVGGRPQIDNPHELGFRDLPILDARGKVLGERRLAGLCGEHQGVRFMVWPQVHLRPASVTYRTDGLLWLRYQQRTAWAMLEFDGPRHRREDDEFRERELALPPLRITHREVTQLKVTTIFLRRAREILKVG